MILTLALALAMAQTPPTQVIGEVTATDAASGQISMKTDKGDAVAVETAAATSFRKVPAGAQNMTAAVKTDFAAVHVGDRVVAVGQLSADRVKMTARAVVVMSRTDLDEKRKAEQEDWRKRGIAGTVSARNAGTLTLAVGSKEVVVQPAANAVFHRYAPDSMRFADARASSLAEIQVGDLVRVLGTRSPDGASYAAERIVSGAFRQFAGTIASLNLTGGELVVKDLATKKNVTVRINAETLLRRLPAQYKAGGASQELGQSLERMPAMPAAELKAGDAVMLSTTAGGTAVVLLAGVEPLLTSPNATRAVMGGWNLGDLGQ